MAGDLSFDRIPAMLLVLVGLAIVAWSVPQIHALAEPGDRYRVDATDVQDGRPCQFQLNTSVENPGGTDETDCYAFSELTDAEQRVVRRGVNRTDSFDGPEASGLQHFESGGDAPRPGEGVYYVAVDGASYRLSVSSGQWKRIGLLVFVPALVIGIVDVGVGLLCYDGRFTIAGPTALLSGHAVLFGPFLLRWGGIATPVPHLGYLLLGTVVTVGAVYLGFEIRRELGLNRS